MLSLTALLVACSGSGLSGTQSAIPGSGTQSQSHRLPLEATGVAPKFLAQLRFGQHLARPNAAPVKDLAVADLGSGAVEVLNGKYKLGSTITSGLYGPESDWYDTKGNLYVANYLGADVTEYNKAESLTSTYTSGLADPISGTTDKSGNVYVADYGFGGPSVVVEYPQGSNSPITSCSTGLANEGIVVDKHGNVFVSGNSYYYGYLIEYSGGLSGCSATTLGVTLGFAGGLQIDKHGNLVACDQYVGVDIIPPPYNSVGSTITGAEDPFQVALNLKQALIYIADPARNDVLVDQYPSGTPVTTLGAGNGLSDPSGVATYGK